MEADFWRERWRLNQIGFHERAVHRFLPAHWQQLAPQRGDGVFVPLCGKSLDLRWFREQGHPVVGVELSPLAVQAFFDEAGLSPTRAEHGALSRWHADGITIYCGDFFALGPDDVAECRLVFDRGSMVALPPAMRRDYVARLKELFPNGARMLLVTFDYPPAEMPGPPFAIGDEDVVGFYSSAEQLASEEVLAANGPLRQRGLTRLHENAYRVDLSTSPSKGSALTA